MNEKLIILYDNTYALRFPYYIVTERTVAMALPSFFRREIGQKKMQVRFAGETEATAGTMRADAKTIKRAFPAEMVALNGYVRNDELKDYIIIKVEPTNR